MESTRTSNIATDTYMFFINLGKMTRTQIEESQKQLETAQARVVALEKDIETEKQRVSDLVGQIEELKVKELDARNMAGEIEKHKSQLKTLVLNAVKK
jgi:outer membrane protein TolC